MIPKSGTRFSEKIMRQLMADGMTIRRKVASLSREGLSGLMLARTLID